MKKSINYIKELLDYLDRFISAKGKEPDNLKEFLIWMDDRVFDREHDSEQFHSDSNPDMELSFLLIMQNKHYKMYSKKVLQDTEVGSPDEFSFLYHLLQVESFRKMELIHIHLLEAPSGIEIIKRLLRKGLIEEFDDTEDRRAKRIRLTEKGKEETEKLIPRMQEVYTRMAGGLSDRDKLHLIGYLKELDEYHSDYKPGNS